MRSSPPDATVSPQATAHESTIVWRCLGTALIGVALIYAFLAAFRTVHDYDIGWQLATGRWVLQHRQVPSVDVFSYTARSRPWIYPVLSSVFFYGLYLLGGYPALTWLTAVASGLTAFFLVRQRSVFTASLGIVAVPVIVDRLTPRADLFSTVFFALVLSVLWGYHRCGRGALWLLPPVFLLWVNLHWGFMAGLGLLGVYAVLELGELPFPAKRPAAMGRLRKAWPWFLASALATLLNPWGPGIYRAVLTWTNDLTTGLSASTLATITTEFDPFRINPSTLRLALDWRNPDTSAVVWLLAIGCIAIAFSAARKNVGATVLLAGAILPALWFVRFQAMSCCIIGVVGGGILAEAGEALIAKNQKQRTRGWPSIANVFTAGLGICLLCLAGFRSYDLVSNRYYLSAGKPFLFGTGLSSWFPERALAFIEREHLPRNVFNGFQVGAFLLWRLPQYPDFIDTRGRPFGGEVIHANAYLPLEGPESRLWQEAADRWRFETIIAPGTYRDFPRLKEFCESSTWPLVYMDETSAVFLRRSPETQPLIDRLRVDFKSVHFQPPEAAAPSRRSRADLFTFWTNAGIMLARLGRLQDALEALNAAQAIFPDSSMVHFQQGELLAAAGRNDEAIAELQRAAKLDPKDGPWEDLAGLLWTEHRSDEAVETLRTGAELLEAPARSYLKLGEAEAQRQHPRKALSALDEATRFSAWLDTSTPVGAEFQATIAENRARIWFSLGDTSRAVKFQEQAVHLTPGEVQRWRDLADLYASVGRKSDAQQALSRAGL